MLLKQILNQIDPLNVTGALDKDIKGVEIDSRKVGEGFLFVAMRGTQVDGHQFIDKAIALGATNLWCAKRFLRK